MRSSHIGRTDDRGRTGQSTGMEEYDQEHALEYPDNYRGLFLCEYLYFSPLIHFLNNILGISHMAGMEKLAGGPSSGVAGSRKHRYLPSHHLGGIATHS